MIGLEIKIACFSFGLQRYDPDTRTPGMKSSTNVSHIPSSLPAAKFFLPVEHSDLRNRGFGDSSP